ncbi:hypothetical protein GGI24_005428 [Coemansia furcata]|nr:hypothetical protein GGI24_005428 [Coemansia furcata]
MFGVQALGTRSGPSLPSEAFLKDIFSYSGQSCNGLDGVLFDTQSLGNFQSLGMFSDSSVCSSPDSLQQLGVMPPAPISAPVTNHYNVTVPVAADTVTAQSVSDTMRLLGLSLQAPTSLPLHHQYSSSVSLGMVNSAPPDMLMFLHDMLPMQCSANERQISTGPYYGPSAALTSTPTAFDIALGLVGGNCSAGQMSTVKTPIVNAEPASKKRGHEDRDQVAKRCKSAAKTDGKCVEFQCTYLGCGKAFARRCNLTSHKLTHTEERPYPCDLCEQRFSRNHDLKRHQKIHTGARPFVCTRCNRGFARADALRRHTSKGSSCKSSASGSPKTGLTNIATDYSDETIAILMALGLWPII